MNEIIDEHSGKGGSYVRDADGKRVLQERTDHAVPVPQQTEPVAVAAQAKPTSTKSTVKGASNA